MHSIILSRYQELEKQIQDIQKQLSAMPDGHLCCTNNGKYHKWYQVKNHLYTYIPKKQKYFAEQLALKKYLSSTNLLSTLFTASIRLEQSIL